MTGPLLTARQVGRPARRLPGDGPALDRRRELPAIRLPGGAVRYREHELERWLASRATEADDGRTSKAAPRGAVTPTRGLTTEG